MRLVDADRMKTVKAIQSADFNTLATIRAWIESQPTVNVLDDLRRIIQALVSDPNDTRYNYGIGDAIGVVDMFIDNGMAPKKSDEGFDEELSNAGDMLMIYRQALQDKEFVRDYYGYRTTDEALYVEPASLIQAYRLDRQIDVGAEVKLAEEYDDPNALTWVITKKCEDGTLEGISPDGAVFDGIMPGKIKRTGRVFNIKSILKQMGG